MRYDRRAMLAAGTMALLAPTLLRAQASSTVRLRRAGGHLFVGVLVNGRRTEALLDTAAEMTVLDRAFAARLGLSGGTTATARGSGAATAAATLVPGVTLAVAGLVLRPATVALIDLGDIGRRLVKGPIDMIVGRELFDAARLAIDLDAGTLAPVTRRLEPRGIRLPLTTRRGVEQVRIAIEGVVCAADLDLGNGGRVLIGAAFAARHRLLGGRALGSIGGGGIGGEAVQTTLTLRSLDIAGRRFANVAAAVDANAQAADANIGVAILDHFNIVTDFAQRAIWLDPRR